MRISQYLWFGLVCAVGIFTVLSACDSGGTANPRSITGSWQGTIETDSVTYQLSFDLERAENPGPTGPRLIGEGELSGEESRSFQITNGSFSDVTMVLALTLRFDVPFPIDLQGTVQDDFQSISAEVSGGPPGFEQESITLTR